MVLAVYPSENALTVSLRLEVSVVPVSKTYELKHRLSETLPGAVLVYEVGAVTKAFPVVPAEELPVG